MDEEFNIGGMERVNPFITQKNSRDDTEMWAIQQQSSSKPCC